MPDVTAIILNWNNYEDTVNCLDSLETLSTCPETIVVDNGSTDGSDQKIKENYPEVKVISLNRNRGFSGGMNAGICQAIQQGSEYVWLLNNDFIVGSDDTIERALNSFEQHDNIGILSPRIYWNEEDCELWFKHGAVDDRSLNPSHQGWGPSLVDLRIKRNTPIRLDTEHLLNDFVPFCSVFIKQDVFDSIGLLIDDYFLYFEDVDFCLRAKDAGYRIATNLEIYGYHEVTGSTSGGTTRGYYNTRNRLILARRRGHIGAKFVGMFAWWVVLMIGWKSFQGDTPTVRGIIHGLADGIRNIDGKGPFP